MEVLTRAPVPGLAKTRLIPMFGAEGAARIHRALALQTLDLVRRSGLDARLHLDGALDSAFADEIRALGFPVVPQVEGDLGARLIAAMAGPGRRIALGTDCVRFDPRWLVEAATAEEPVVIGPAEDGGYWTIAVDAPLEAVFCGIPWSTSEVLERTLAVAHGLGFRVRELPGSYDIDEPVDLMRLMGDPTAPRMSP